MSQVNIQDVQQKLYEKLKPSGWGDKLKTFLLSEDFTNILNQLLEESESGKHFTPIVKQIFRAFEECPYEELKIVFIGQDPYPKAGVADGISFSCSNEGKIQTSLKFIYKELEATVYPEGMEWNPDLKHWSNQGILMLNTALTTTAGKIGAHVELWKPFMMYLLDMLNAYNSGLVYVFLGKKAQAWNEHISANNFKCFSTHPASAAYRGKLGWDSGDLFNQINNIIHEHYGTNISWKTP
jgi:uracil-DNA glycosylase